MGAVFCGRRGERRETPVQPERYPTARREVPQVGMRRRKSCPAKKLFLSCFLRLANEKPESRLSGCGRTF